MTASLIYCIIPRYLNEQRGFFMEYEDSIIAQTIRRYIYDAENPDWSALKRELLVELGYTEEEVFYIMKDVRDGVL